MKRISSFLLLIVLLIGLTACNNGSAVKNTDGAQASPEYSYVEDMLTLQDVMRYSTNIVKATLTSFKDFNGVVNVYSFDVDEDYTDNTPDKINMYDGYNEAYIVGHTYYLFLCRGEDALYPHTIYSTVLKHFIVDEADEVASAEVNSSKITLQVNSAPEIIAEAVEAGIVGERAGAMTEISTASDIKTLSEEADVIAEIKVSSETNANIYASTYQVEVINIVKGAKDAVPSVINLPPALSAGKSYYVFLREDAENAGTYVLFSRSFPAVDAAGVNTEDLF